MKIKQNENIFKYLQQVQVDKNVHYVKLNQELILQAKQQHNK